jgi:hypothetical protein
MAKILIQGSSLGSMAPADTVHMAGDEQRVVFIGDDGKETEVWRGENWSASNYLKKGGKHEIEFKRGDKVIYLPEDKVYDFGYIGKEGNAIIYKEGCANMQDSYAVDLDKIKKRCLN